MTQLCADFIYSQESSGLATLANDNLLNIQIEHSGTNYNVSWTIEKPNSKDHIKQYLVKWYDALSGKELGSASTTVNKPYIGKILLVS